MRALVYDEFGGPLQVRQVPAPVVPPAGVLVRVGASGVCRSDWHGWQGHDSAIALPHVPGHELAGTIEAIGPQVRRWQIGDRVTAPFVCACGRCPRCAAGDQQVCEHQSQPGFTHWGSFAEFVALDAGDVNLVALPAELSFGTAAILGCRYSTAFRAVVQQGRLRAGQWVAVHGCGGVGLSAIQIAVAAGARVVAVDISTGALAMARHLGAHATVDASTTDAARAVLDLTGGGADLSIDALGSEATCAASILSLRPRGRHVQVGLLIGRPEVPMDRVIALELELLGSHGMAAHSFPELLTLVVDGWLRPGALITRELDLVQAGQAIREVGRQPGISVVTSF